MPPHSVRVAVLDDHQGVIDGYTYRLGQCPSIHIVGAAANGEQLEALLAANAVDVVILDVGVPTSPTNPSPYPILHVLPQLHERYPSLYSLIISMVTERALIKALVDAGASGYILKDDVENIKQLAAVVLAVAAGDRRFSPQAQHLLQKYTAAPGEAVLSPRQQEALSLAAAYPGRAGIALAQSMNVTHSTFRNLLSLAYLRLGASNRAEAILKARALGLISPLPPSPDA